MDILDVDQAGNNLPQTVYPAFVFLIDSGRKMVPKNFLLSLTAIRKIATSHITREVPCYCSIILMSTNKSSNSVNAQNICSIFPLSVIGAPFMKEIERLENLLENDEFDNEYGSGAFCLPDALWIASNTIFELKRKIKKNIIVFTNEKTPFAKKQDLVRAMAKVCDLQKNKVNLEFVEFGKSTLPWLLELFDVSPGDESVKPFSVDEIVVRHLGQKRQMPQVKIPMYISDDLFLHVNVYSTCRSVKMPYETSLSRETNAPVTTKLTKVSAETGEVLDAQKTVRVADTGGAQVVFTNTEMKEIRAIGGRQLKLLGFKPRSVLSLSHHVHPSSFIYPNEKTCNGSTALFSALLKGCIEKEVVAICKFCPKDISSVKYVALVPQTEQIEDGVQVAPPGFLMVFLPFGDQIRDTDDLSTKSETASPEQVNLMKEVVKKIRFPFKPENFPNPKLAAYWSAVEALALDYEAPADYIDASLPNTEMIGMRLGSLPEEINLEIFPGGQFSQASSSRPAKQQNSLEEDIKLVEDQYRDKTLHQLKLDSLKNYLKHVGLGSGLSKMKKADLIDRINHYMKKR